MLYVGFFFVCFCFSRLIICRHLIYKRDQEPNIIFKSFFFIIIFFFVMKLNGEMKDDFVSWSHSSDKTLTGAVPDVPRVDGGVGDGGGVGWGEFFMIGKFKPFLF